MMTPIDKDAILKRANTLLTEILENGVTPIVKNQVVYSSTAEEFGLLVFEYKLVLGPDGIKFPE